MNENHVENRSSGRLVLVWALGVIQIITTTALAAGVGALWTLSVTMSSLVVEVTNIKSDVSVMKIRHDKHEAEVKRVSDEQIRRGVILEQLKARK